jgi:exopolysaccharide biosynthesis polyprenyl glycosylphosphotransferase
VRRFVDRYLATPWFALGAFEALFITLSLCVLFYFSFPSGQFHAAAIVAALALSLGIVFLTHSSGLYAGESVLSAARAVRRIVILTVPIFALAVLTTGELARHTGVPIYPYRWQWTFALTAIWMVIALGLRALFRHVHGTGVLTREIVVVGSRQNVSELDSLALQTYGRFKISACFEPDAWDAARSAAVRSRISEIVATKDAFGSLDCPRSDFADAGVRITEFNEFYERHTGRVCIEHLPEGWAAQTVPSCAYGFVRRIFDVVASLAGLIAVAPLLLLTALAIKLEDGGRVFYRQERVGLGGRVFTLLKFRSMRENAEQNGVPAWAQEGDCRVTRVGRFIRMVRIDELPQFLNVLQGDMAIIGPRPERPFFVTQFSKLIPHYDCRHMLKPGITGWAQVSFRYGASVEDTRRKLAYDLYYAKNRGFVLDVLVLLKTVAVILSGEGAR